MKSIRMTLARWSHLRLFASTLLGAALLSACDGENLFDPTENPYGDLQVTLSGANGGVAGDTLRFLVTGAGPNGLNRFDVAVRGAVSKDTSLVVANTGRQVSGTVKLVLPQTLIDTVLYVSARGYDTNGNMSPVVSDTFVVFEPPTVSMSGGELLVPGAVATFKVHATGKRPISQITVVKTGAIPFSNETASVLSTDVSRDFLVAIPSEPSDTLLNVSVTVKDVNGLTTTRTYVRPVQVTGPEVTVLQAPGSAAPGGSLAIFVAGKAMRGVDSLKVVLSGAYDAEKTIKVAGLKATNLTKFIFALPPNLTGSTISVDAYAFDRGGPSQSVSWTVVLATGNPVVDSLQVAPVVPAGGRLDVRAFLSGPRPLGSVTVRVRGSVFKEVTTAIGGSLTSAVSDIFIPVSVGDVVTDPTTWNCGATSCSTQATVDVMVTDQAGLPSYWSAPVTFLITNLPKPADPSGP